MESGMISVDKWSSGSQVYFLTHLHADHTAGLSCKWRRGLLFCSPLTAKLFPCKFPDFDVSLIRILDIGTWHSLRLTSPSSGNATSVLVKAIDAQHCPGSVMYLFRGDFGSMLFTGDFRWESKSKRAENGRAVLLDALKNDPLDRLYLDNTYCNPRYVFPPREVAAQQVVDIITSHPNHDIVIGVDSLGKEDLLLYIARTLDIMIWVWPERLQIMDLLGFQEIFTTKTALTRVRAVPRYSFSVDTLEKLNVLRPTIGVMPSGLPWMKSLSSYSMKRGCGEKTGDLGGSSGAATRYNDYIYVVPYSDHSCFSEIKEFIELLRPVNVKGIVTSSSCYIAPRYYFDHLCGTEQAMWRIQQRKLENGEATDEIEEDEIISISEITSAILGKKRKIDRVDFHGVRASRVDLMRRFSRGAKIADSDEG